jgi:hypothetical protein
MNKIESLKDRIPEALKEGMQLCFLVRDSELQRAYIYKLTLLREEVGQAKAAYAEHEDSANLCLSLEYSLDAQLNELKMWLALKDNQAGVAWGHLVDAQSATHWAVLAHKASENLLVNQERLLLVEKLVFPPQVFFSTEMIVREALCSICGSIYGECDHIVGRPYKGQLCFRRLTKCDVQEVSFVDEPANKHCRILTIVDEGVKRDYLTRRPIDEKQD